MAPIYADHPFPLIATPDQETKDVPDMFSRVACEMTLVHNMIIRGLNSIYLQAPLVSAADAPSFLQYCRVWYALLYVHHTGEEKEFFPYVEDATGKKGLMDNNLDQHRAFQVGVESFKAYIDGCVAGKQKFEGAKLTRIMDGFGEVLAKHLGDEIPTLLQLREYGMGKLGDMEKRFQLEGEKNMKMLGLVDGLPFCFCNHDVRFEGGRWASWPPAPMIVHILARNVTYWAHRDWWKFAACDRHGHLRPLHALAEQNHPTILSLALAQALIAPGAVAQSLDETIVGCAEVECPTAGRSTSAECQLVDKTLGMIGLARVPVEADALEGLSWVEGVAIADPNDGNRTFDKSFYLGTPPSLSLNSTGACALFFTHVSDRVRFDDEDDDLSVSQGTCEEAMSKKCVSALISRAEDLDVDGLSSGEACKKLQEEFEDNLDSECASFADRSKWVSLETIDLEELIPNREAAVI
ncbi:hypothetical protein QQX98_013356, partial [Neonectria punicea]